MEGKKHAPAFCLGKGSASHAIRSPHDQRRLADPAALAHSPDQVSRELCKFPFAILRKAVDFETHEVEVERRLTPDAAAVSRILGSVAYPAGDGFTLAD